MFLQTPRNDSSTTNNMGKTSNDITEGSVTSLHENSTSNYPDVQDARFQRESRTESTTAHSQTEESDITEGYDTDLEDLEEIEMQMEEISSDIKEYIKECSRCGAIPVSYFQRHIQESTFVMRYYGLGPNGAKAIAKPLETNTTIEVLNLEGNDISADGVFYLMQALNENVSISEMDLSDNDLRSRGAQLISSGIKHNHLIKQLYLSTNNFRDSDGVHFYDMLIENKILEKLVLQHNFFEFEAPKWFKKALQENITLQCLDLGWNKIHLRGAIYIAEMIRDNYGLKSLNLQMNGLGISGAAAMGAALKHNRTLTDLNISFNRINNQGIMQFSKGLVSNEVLENLTLKGNPIDEHGAFGLICALGNNKHRNLKLLDLSNIRIKENFQKVLKNINDKNDVVHLHVIHGGLHSYRDMNITDEDPRDTFERDPMTKLKRYAQKHKLRLVDLFRQFDKEQKWSIDLDTLRSGIKSTGIPLNETEIEKLMDILGQDKDGKVYYREFLDGDKSNRAELRQILKDVTEDKLKQEELKQKNKIKDFQFKDLEIV